MVLAVQIASLLIAFGVLALLAPSRKDPKAR